MIYAEDNMSKRTRIMEKYYGKKVTATGIIKRLCTPKNEKGERVDFKEKNEENTDNSFLHEQGTIVNPFYYLGETMLKDVQISADCGMTDNIDHLWISEDIYKQIPGIKEGDKVRVIGIVRKYKKRLDNEVVEDYCINEVHVEAFRT